MATITNGILGGFSGKIGTVVGYTLGGKHYMRSLPKSRTQYTPNELINQAMFEMVWDYLEPLKDLIRVGFKSYFAKTGGYQAAVSYTRKIAMVKDDAGF
ncbi:MAG: hypothetical protein H7Y07_16195 [Pyrinomonadaceae bacterium]|nr:hypothetical protein [Sphingobacteriaceae bacterium]